MPNVDLYTTHAIIVYQMNHIHCVSCLASNYFLFHVVFKAATVKVATKDKATYAGIVPFSHFSFRSS